MLTSMDLGFLQAFGAEAVESRRYNEWKNTQIMTPGVLNLAYFSH
jgi:hypothetical protein